MSLEVELLPSTDGSSTLVVGRLGGVATRLPRGEITLTLRYEPAEAGLVKLRPKSALPGGHETVTLTFVQPFGRTWPAKPPKHDGFHLPHIPVTGVKVPSLGPPNPGPLHELVEILRAEQRL
jgi:hypothetical protein